MMRLILDILGGLLSYLIVGILLVSAFYGGLFFLRYGAVFSALFLVLLGVVAFIVLRFARRISSSEEDQ